MTVRIGRADVGAADITKVGTTATRETVAAINLLDTVVTRRANTEEASLPHLVDEGVSSVVFAGPLLVLFAVDAVVRRDVALDAAAVATLRTADEDLVTFEDKAVGAVRAVALVVVVQAFADGALDVLLVSVEFFGGEEEFDFVRGEGVGAAVLETRDRGRHVADGGLGLFSDAEDAERMVAGFCLKDVFPGEGHKADGAFKGLGGLGVLAGEFSVSGEAGFFLSETGDLFFVSAALFVLASHLVSLLLLPSVGGSETFEISSETGDLLLFGEGTETFVFSRVVTRVGRRSRVGVVTTAVRDGSGRAGAVVRDSVLMVVIVFIIKVVVSAKEVVRIVTSGSGGDVVVRVKARHGGGCQ